MSSLAGALVPSQDASIPSGTQAEGSFTSENDVPDDVEMQPVIPPKDDHDHEPQEEQDEEMADLFGNDNDVEESKPEGSAASPVSAQDSDRLPSPERERRRALEYEEEDIPPEIAVEVTEANVAFPNIPVPKSSDGDNWVIRMPNFVKVDSKPYHPDTYMGPEHEDEEAQQAETLREKSMTIKLKVENTMRWRWTKDDIGHDRRQSNSRIVRWSDGTLSLRLGKELFDINQSIDTSGGVPRQSFGGPQASQSQLGTPNLEPLAPGAKSQGLTYLVAQHKRAQVLQSEALVTGYMTLRPTGMQSETHRMLVRAVGQKHNKVARLRMAPDPKMDPEREKLELMKLSAKRSKKKADLEDGFGGGRKRRYSRKRAELDVWSDDEDDTGPSFIEEEVDDGTDVGGSGRKANRKIVEDDDKKGAGEYQEDDFVVADSSDEEAGSEGTGRKTKRHRDVDDEMEEDPLDKLDAKIREQQDAQKRRQRDAGVMKDVGGGYSAADAEEEQEEDAMDVESEEEEEEFKVRRVGGPASRRRQAINFEEEEEDE